MIYRPIHIASDRDVAPLLRRLRMSAGLSMEQLGRRVHITKKGVLNRELHSRAVTAGAFIDTARALGYSVMLHPPRRPGVRDTGTGWPA